MKHLTHNLDSIGEMSLPLRGAWIETLASDNKVSKLTSLPLRGAWIETAVIVVRLFVGLSLPLRGAWIETLYHDSLGR